MPLLSIDDLHVTLGARAVLEDIDLHLDRGEIVTLVGPNGSGKSTLLRTIIGAVRPARGRLVRQPGLTIGYVPQRLVIDATLPMTVTRLLNLPRRHPPPAIRQALEQAGIPGLGRQQVTDLSGGQFQRILLARASGIDPKRGQLVLTLSLAIVVAVALKVVGVLLIAALLFAVTSLAGIITTRATAMNDWRTR